ncbi:hypothetical protein [Clostridium sp. D33t1_170424_F3]|uniref:hypothetical protein n=1 Tax=Clostridium sp. D33t1_170424_F3 TaxID=2787099 RepID=UPI0018A9A634|nr:hypothetical protein [Clostridium sp. D33t1_170424_F3]
MDKKESPPSAFLSVLFSLILNLPNYPNQINNYARKVDMGRKWIPTPAGERLVLWILTTIFPCYIDFPCIFRYADNDF